MFHSAWLSPSVSPRLPSALFVTKSWFDRLRSWLSNVRSWKPAAPFGIGLVV
jgi:hypothetical protein